jgi:ribosomal protein S14
VVPGERDGIVTRRVVPDDRYDGGPLHRTSPCVRCGRRPRYADTFLCRVCLDDPATRAEMLRIERSAVDHIGQRRVAIERFHWSGGWGTRR